MDAKEYYSRSDSGMADVVIAAQSALRQIIMEALVDHDYPTDDVTVEDTMKELCKVTLQKPPRFVSIKDDLADFLGTNRPDDEDVDYYYNAYYDEDDEDD